RLTATSISITARVLSELNALSSREGQIILGAAVADDVLGLIVLAVVTQVVRTGSVDAGGVLRSTLLAFGFLAAALVLGIPAGRRLVGVVARANARGGLLAASVGFAMVIAYLAFPARSAPLIGAFAAGLALAPTHPPHHNPPAPQPAR